MTQDINVTVQNRFKTLSNGLLINSIDNKDGTRTDYWSQKLAHVPYLAMLAIGEFLVTTDTWKDIDVEYFLEEEYHPYASNIWKNARCAFSRHSRGRISLGKMHKKIGFCVRSNGKYNRSNTRICSNEQRELLDDHEEDIIAHELIIIGLEI